MARIVSLQGNIALWTPQEPIWKTATTGAVLCPQYRVRVGADSRAALLLINETTLRLNQKTTITINPLQEPTKSFIDLIEGAIHIMTRTPMPFQIHTPFVNANIEGTEFAVAVDTASTTISVLEGKVAAENARGRIVLTEGEAAVATIDTAPRKALRIRPTDAVQWALYTPTILELHPYLIAQADNTVGKIRLAHVTASAVQLYQQGKIAEAIAVVDSEPAATRDAHSADWLTFHAGLLLAVGRLDDAIHDVDQALSQDPLNAQAYALKTIIALTKNEKNIAQNFANKATDLQPSSAVAWLARSYAEQAYFESASALNSAHKATVLSPQNSLTWARRAELELAAGNLDRAIHAATTASKINPDLATIQTVLGFSYLARMQTTSAKLAFDKAIARDQSDPMPRLGLGLARIRDGDLVGGRSDIAIAASLDPADPLLRSYLGKAYFEENRTTLAAHQFALAKQFDPLDPTPWFFDAMRKQTENRPVEALSDLQESMRLNQHRAVYRSQLLLNSDRASRQTSIAKIYDDLALSRFAVTEATQSLTSDPSNYSGHRFLSDAYARLDRHEIASVSELLQAQLLQPLNLNPIQAKLAFSNVSTPGISGPIAPAFNEFNPLFERNGARLVASALAGSQGTLSAEAALTGLQNQLSYSVGDFHYKSDGFRINNDIRHKIDNLFLQYAVSPQLNLQAEIRHRETEHGDISLTILPGTYSSTYRRRLDQTTTRLGAHWAASPSADSLISFIHTQADERQRFDNVGDETVRSKDQGTQFEAQQLLHYDQANIVAGIGTYHFNVDETVFGAPNQFKRTRRNAYSYAHLRPLDSLVWTVGASFDDYVEGNFKQRTGNPKAGLEWQFNPQWRLRAATFSTVKPALYVQQTIEPTEVAGFNQFYDDGNGARARRTAIALDLKAAANLDLQLEASRRRISLPILADNALTTTESQQEKSLRLSAGWRINPRWTVDGEVQMEQFNRQSELLFGPTRIHTTTAKLALRYFNPNGIFARISSTAVRQNVDSSDGTLLQTNSEHFALLDAALGLRLPHRMGTVTLEGKNLFDKKFRYQDANFRTPAQQSPPFIPARSVAIQVTAAF